MNHKQQDGDQHTPDAAQVTVHQQILMAHPHIANALSAAFVQVKQLNDAVSAYLHQVHDHGPGTEVTFIGIVVSVPKEQTKKSNLVMARALPRRTK